MRLALGLIAVLAALAVTDGSADAQEPEGRDRGQEAKHKAQCRLAHQVLTRGQPAVKRDWALGKIGTCEELGGEAIASELERLRSTEARTQELESVVLATSRFVDREVAQTALDIASDPSAGVVARVQAIRILSYQLSPGTNAPYESFVEPGGGIFVRATEPVVVGEPLPANMSETIHNTLADIRDAASAPEPVRTAAENVARQAQAGEF